VSFKMQDGGMRFLAELLSGSPKRINCLYVEYGTVDATGVKTPQYFRDMNASKTCGYAKVPVLTSYVDDACVIHFNSVVRGEDFRGMKPKTTTVLKAVTLAYSPGDSSEDILICTLPFDAQVKISKNVQTAIHASMKLGI